MESEFHRYLSGRLPSHYQLELGPGDDAAVLRLNHGRAVLTVDMLTDGVDFELQKVGASRAGRKALAVNLSDVAAMAARPTAALVALVVPRQDGFNLAKDFFEGLLPLAAEYGIAIAGGDTNSWDGPLVASITLIGEPTGQGVLRRSGAKPGDRIVVTGSFGGSILGHHLDFQPRVREAIELHSRHALHAGLDCSDGLSLDLWRMCEASKCGAVLELDKIPLASAAHELAASRQDGRTAIDHALEDGEDFELILAVPPGEIEGVLAEANPLGCPLAVIGTFVDERGLWTTSAGGPTEPLAPRGYVH